MVVVSSLHPAYQEALNGIKDALGRDGYGIHLVDLGGKEDVAAVKAAFSRSGYPLIITVGTLATETARKAMPKVPLVFSMVLEARPSFVGEGGATGVVIDIPVVERLRWFKRLVPDIKRVGIIYSTRIARLVKQAQDAAKDLSLDVVPLEISSPSQLPKAQEELVEKADALLAVPDSMIYNSTLTPHLILFTLRHKIPFMGLSRNFTRSGALLSLDCDYREVGLQSGGIALRVLRGETVSSIPVAYPEEIYPVVNERIAAILGVRLSPQVAGRGK